MKPPFVTPEAYWTYKAPPWPAVPPPEGFKGNWHSLSPGMRRAIWRDYERRIQSKETNPMQNIAPEYANAELKVKPGDRLHRIVALLFDTYYDDLTDRIPEVERFIEGFRWCNADGKRVDAHR